MIGQVHLLVMYIINIRTIASYFSKALIGDPPSIGALAIKKQDKSSGTFLSNV